MVDVEEFRREGYTVLRGVVDPGLLDDFTGVLARRVDELAEGRFGELGFTRRLAALYEGRDLDRREWRSRLFTREYWRLVTSVSITDPLAVLLGEEVTYQGNSHLRPYLPRHLDRLPWHQDGQFYGAGVEAMLWDVVQVWLPLVDVSVDSGCMALVPRSHRAGLVSDAMGPDTDPEEVYRRTAEHVRFEPVHLVPMRRGDLLLFTNLLVHTGTENRSGEVRWSVDMRFESTRGSRPSTPELEEGRRVLRARMVSRAARPLRVRGASGPQSFEEWAA